MGSLGSAQVCALAAATALAAALPPDLLDGSFQSGGLQPPKLPPRPARRRRRGLIVRRGHCGRAHSSASRSSAAITAAFACGAVSCRRLPAASGAAIRQRPPGHVRRNHWQVCTLQNSLVSCCRRRCCRALVDGGAKGSAQPAFLPASPLASAPPTPETSTPSSDAPPGSQAGAAGSPAGLTDAEATLGDAVTSFSGAGSQETSPDAAAGIISLAPAPPPQENICECRRLECWLG